MRRSSRAANWQFFCADSSVDLVAGPNGIEVSRVGVAVAATLGLMRGKLMKAEPRLGARLGRGFAGLGAAGKPVSFKASYLASNVDSGERAVRLTRGVLLPLLDVTSELTEALAILTWKQALSDADSARLRRELDRAGSPDRAGNRYLALPQASSLFAVFAPAASVAKSLRDIGRAITD